MSCSERLRLSGGLVSVKFFAPDSISDQSCEQRSVLPKGNPARCALGAAFPGRSTFETLNTW